ncbi:juvenile hormone-binding protein [Plutella xylostella]|uniref:juvenile hormone-binding protein n=1 Tax=Plutella xylostella TaxID=51655 RepID=UPI0020330766|nr:juvenile hormone-binding protein [Plutella xylostella]
MKVAVIPCLFVLVGCVFAKPEAGSIASVCNAEDEECVKESLKTFLRTTSQGIPAFDVRPLDPNVIPRINYTLGAFGVGYTFNNLTVTGMKNLRLAEYNIDRAAKTSLIKTEATLDYVSDVEIDYLKLGKVFTGKYTGAGKALVTVKYPYGITTDDKGVRHLTCTTCNKRRSNPQVAEIRSKLEEAKDKEAALKAGFCRLAKTVFTTFVHNIRASAKGLPKEAFFKNI